MIKRVLTMLLIFMLTIGSISTVYAKGNSGEDIKIKILKKYKAISTNNIDNKIKSTTEKFEITNDKTEDISNFKIKSVIYFDKNGNVARKFEEDEALNHLIEMETMESDDFYSQFPYESRLVETEDNNVETTHRKDYDTGIKFEDIANQILSLGINISSAYWNKTITFAYAALTSAGQSSSEYDIEDVMVSNGPTFVITENSYIVTRTYEVLNVYNEGSDYEPAFVSKDKLTSLGCAFYSKTATEDISAYEYLEDYIRETGTSFNDKIECHKLAIEYYKNSGGILPRYDNLEGDIDDTTLNNILDEIKSDGYEDYLE